MEKTLAGLVSQLEQHELGMVASFIQHLHGEDTARILSPFKHMIVYGC